MKQTVFLRKAQHPLMMATGTLPVLLLLLARLSPMASSKLPIFLLVYIGLAWLCILLPGRWRVPCAIAGSILLFIAAFLLLPIRQQWFLLTVPAAYSGLLVCALPIGGWPMEKELPPFWIASGIVFHLLAQIFTKSNRLMLMIVFLLFAAMALLSLNRSSLNMAAQARVSVPVQMRHRNTLLTLGLLALSVLVASMPAIAGFLQRCWNEILTGIKSILHFIASLLSRQEGGAGSGESGAFIAMAGEEESLAPSLFQRIVEIVVSIVAVIALLALLVWLGRKLFRRLRQLLGWLWQRLNQLSSAAVKDYEDEITDTRDDGQYQHTSVFKQLRMRLSRMDESRMSPAERIRYRYLRLRMKHQEWSEASTARENLPEEAAQLYEQVRYGNMVSTDEEAQQFINDIQRL